MIIDFALIIAVVSVAHFISQYSPLSQYNWYLNWLHKLMDKTKSPRLSNLYMKVFLSKIFTCNKCHFFHWMFMFFSIVLAISGSFLINPFLEAVIMALVIWYANREQ